MRAFARAVGRAVPRALRRHRPEAAPVPLRRAGQLARPHRAAAREQRVADPDRGARRDAVARRALPRAPAADVERGAVAAAAVGSAVVAAAAADPRVRDRSARVRRSVRRQPGRSRRKVGELCAAARAELARDRRHGRHPRRDRDRLLQARARALDGGADGADRARRADRRRRQQVDRRRCRRRWSAATTAACSAPTRRRPTRRSRRSRRRAQRRDPARVRDGARRARRGGARAASR